MIRGIVFDLFDTLVDQDLSRLVPVEHAGRPLPPSTPRLYEHATREAGIEVSLDEFVVLQREVDRGLRAETLATGLELPTRRRFAALATRLGSRDPEDLAEAFCSIHMDMVRSVVRVPAHHQSVLRALAVDHRLGLCSNFSHAPTAREILRSAHLDGLMSATIVSEEVGVRKPRPEIFQAVVRALELAPREILHVGDDLGADVAGAAAVGMRTVWLTRCVRDPEAALRDYDGPRPDFALEDLLDLPVLVARLGRSDADGRADDRG